LSALEVGVGKIDPRKVNIAKVNTLSESPPEGGKVDVGKICIGARKINPIESVGENGLSVKLSKT
jgi:hypothetical protein